MQVAERRRRVLAAVQARGTLTMRELAGIVGTTEVTARRDTRELAAQGLLHRTHGRVSHAQPLSREPSYDEKSAQASVEKALIAQAAAVLVLDDEAIALGAGTTTLALALLLTERSELTVLTNSLLVCQALLHAPGVQVLVSGGQLRPSTHALIGPIAEQSLGSLYVSTLFVSGNGLSAKRGLSTPDVLAAAVDRRLAESSAQIVVLADYTKIGVEAVSQTVPVEQIDRLVTDDRADRGELRRLEAAGVDVIVAPRPTSMATAEPA